MFNFLFTFISFLISTNMQKLENKIINGAQPDRKSPESHRICSHVVLDLASANHVGMWRPCIVYLVHMIVFLFLFLWLGCAYMFSFLFNIKHMCCVITVNYVFPVIFWEKNPNWIRFLWTCSEFPKWFKTMFMGFWKILWDFGRFWSIYFFTILTDL